MDAERMGKTIDMLQVIRDDITKDVNDLDGKPLTGPVVGEHIGYICAQVYTLAEMLSEVVEHLRDQD